jgi:N-succinyldiaminopimelate aminotransferase
VYAPILEADSAEDAVQAVRDQIGPRTVALYWNTPNNPTGINLPASWLRGLADLARERDLWILADEVYEDYVYAGTHTYSRPLAPERTVAAYSFSKAYGMAGNRVGYLVGPEAFLDQVRKVCTHTFYSTPTGGQLAALHALGPAGDAWIANAHRAYAELGRYAANRLGVPAPEGSTFLFVDVASALDTGGLEGFLERAVDRGLLVAPGPTFGPFPRHVRVCFTSAPPERVRAGIDVLAELLGR